ncbi:hypothetical protein E2C01_101434 [Portunus trituberculatus]|nr:hypothetical protein [Portunus trituberculatus]
MRALGSEGSPSARV